MINTFKYIACCLVGVLALLPMQAQNIIRPKIAGPGNLWVNSYNGVLFFGQTDFETQDSAMPMQLRFYYNSSASEKDYGYGLGFSMGYEMCYREDVIGGVDIESGDGRIDHYTKYGDEYKAPAGVFSTLVRPTFDTYLLTTKDGTKYFFDSAHHRKVTAIEDRNGNRTTFKYQDTLLVEVKDAVGHTITLSYTDGLMTQASVTFSPGKYKYEYDGLRRLRKRIDPLGNVTLYNYSRQNKLDVITDANGNKTFIAYNSSGMVSRMKTDVSDKSIRYEDNKTVFIDYTEPNNVYSYYQWDDKGRAIEKVGLCCGIQSTLKYDDNNNIAQRIDANGNATNYTYDEQGNMLTLRDPLGYTEQYTYEPNFNQVASFRDKNGNSYTFSYDTKGNLTALDGPLGFNNRYSYNEHGWQTMITDANGNVTRTTYNSDGTKSSVTNADGGVVKYAYDTYGRMKSQTDPMGNTTSYTYDNLGRLTKETNALGYSTTTTYDKVGNAVRILDAAGNVTAYSYDALDHMTSMTDAMGGVYTYEYDGRGNVISVIDPIGIKQHLKYNDRNKLESYTNGEGEKTEYDYDPKGNLIAEMRPNGNIISYEYDELDRLIETSDNIGLIAIYEYDGNGNRVSETDGLKRRVTYEYDALNHIISEVLPSGSKTHYQYDAVGNVISVTDALGHITSYSYDAMNRQLFVIDALNAKTQFAYDVNGNNTRIIDAKGNTTSFAYDALNHNTSVTFANGKSLQYTYDQLGNISMLIDRAGNEFRYDYDPKGNLLKKIYPDGTADKYTYDAISRLISAINNNASVKFSYDRAGRVISESLNGKSTKYSYDVSMGIHTLTYPSGMKVIENLNARDHITNIIQNGIDVVSMSYNVAGEKINQTYSNGIITNYEYNENGWLNLIKDSHGIVHYEMVYDPIGNITKRKDLIISDRTESYSYDQIGQIISFLRGSTSETWEYDLLGNRIKSITDGKSTSYQVNNVNAYISVNGNKNVTFQYDGNDNLIYDGSHHFIFDYNNCISETSDLNVSYKYDALGRRISKGNTHFFYAGFQMLEEETSNIFTSYIYGNRTDEVLQMNRNNNTFYYHTNHLGSTVAISDIDANLIEHVEYGSFGNHIVYDSNGEERSNSNIFNSLLYTGREYDVDNGTYYYRARTLNPLLGRFVQHDPLGYVDGTNDYLYVLNMPNNYIDPFGLYDFSVNGPNFRGSGGTGNYYSTGNQAAKYNPENMLKAKESIFKNGFKQGGKQFAKQGGKILAQRAAVAGGMIFADGPLPIGDIIGGLLVGGTILGLLFDACNGD